MIKTAWERLLALWHTEPARVSAAVAVAVAAALTAAGYATDVVHVTPWVALVLPLLFGAAEATRGQVKPLRRPVATEHALLPEPDGNDKHVTTRKTKTTTARKRKAVD